MRLMLLKAVSYPSQLLEAYTLNTVAVVTGIKSKLCLFLSQAADHCIQLVKKRQKLVLCFLSRDTVLNTRKFYITFQQDRKNSKACFYPKSSCAKPLVFLTDTLLSLWGLQINSFSCFECCLWFERRLISLSSVISVTLSCRSRGPFADTKGPFVDTHAIPFFQALLRASLWFSNHNRV